ncbi:hypothetical protein CKA32_000501 [Geitlerinema sp. FC II]|nr:hypothetical protein CKA32_000501 [Geitlerinema sp. FC II]
MAARRSTDDASVDRIKFQNFMTDKNKKRDFFRNGMVVNLLEIKNKK